MKAWWRTEPLNEQEEHLLAVLLEAHHASALRENASSVAIANAAAASNDIGKAIAAGILTLGGRHAPLEQTIDFLTRKAPVALVWPMLDRNLKIPGWGGTFQKEGPDPIWSKVDAALHDHEPRLADTIDCVTKELHRSGKNIFPNPSAYTASVAIALRMPSKLAVYLFISARLDAWASIALSNSEGVKQ